MERVAEALETYVSCRHHLLRPLIVSELLRGVQYATLSPGTGADVTVTLRRGND